MAEEEAEEKKAEVEEDPDAKKKAEKAEKKATKEAKRQARKRAREAARRRRHKNWNQPLTDDGQYIFVVKLTLWLSFLAYCAFVTYFFVGDKL